MRRTSGLFASLLLFSAGWRREDALVHIDFFIVHWRSYGGQGQRKCGFWLMFSLHAHTGVAQTHTQSGDTHSVYQLCHWVLALSEQLSSFNQMLLYTELCGHAIHFFSNYYYFHVWQQSIATIWCTVSALERGNDQTLLTTFLLVYWVSQRPFL